MFYWPFEAKIPEAHDWERRGGATRTKGFRSARGGGRLHAACDLAVPRGTPIRAISDGEVLEYHDFYEGTWALAVIHKHEGLSFIARYGEVLGPPDGIRWQRGAEVRGGQVIAKVGQLNSGKSMLHLELYAETRRAPSLSIARSLRRDPNTYSEQEQAAIRTRGWHWDFQRRLDLADPTEFLLELRKGHRPPQPTALAPAARAGSHVIQMEPIVITPSEEYYKWRREQDERALARQYINRGDLAGLTGGRARTPGPLCTALRPGTECAFVCEPSADERRGPAL